MQTFLLIVFLLLLANFLIAMVVVLRRAGPQAHTGGWLLVLLLSSTTGTALVAILVPLQPVAGSRTGEVSFIFVGLAAVSAVVAVLAHRLQLRHDAPDGDPAHGSERSGHAD